MLAQSINTWVRASASERPHLFLFDELFRGTNAVERIAAGEAVLRELTRGLIAGQRADDLFIEIHRLTHNTLPREERSELSSQLRRAAYSVPANIVEGYARQFRKEKFHFLSIASASLAEVGYGLHAAWRLGYLAPAQYDALELQVRQVAAPLNGLSDRYRSGDPVEGVSSR